MPRDSGFSALQVDDTRLRMHEILSSAISDHIQSVVEFAKAIPGFVSLDQPDQLTLLKAAFPEVWILQAARTISYPEQTILLCNGAIVCRKELDFIYSSTLMCAIFEFAAEFNALNLSDIEIGLYSAILLTKSNRNGLSDTAKVAAIHERFLAALSYQLEEKHGSVSDIMNGLKVATGRLAQISESLHFVMSWFRSLWYRTHLPPLYSEIFDIAQGDSSARVPQAQPYMPIDFQSLTCASAQAPVGYNTGTTSYMAAKAPQTLFHYHQYQNFPASQDYFAMYNAQGNTYPNMTDYTDESNQQQFIYTSGHERWHSSAFEPYSTDMQSTVRTYSHETQRVDSDVVGDHSRDENASTSTYTESHVRSRSHSSTTSPGSITSVADSTIVSGDDPFTAYQSVDVPALSRANSNVADIEAEGIHPNWENLSELNGLEKDANGLKPEMPTLIPAPEIMAAIERRKDISTPLESMTDEGIEHEEMLPVENRNGS
ncbi:unnamed protein product [Hydatigera taeniaeformis]|uniref:NR LBD domain-containing protein n=1 Tax=Hydatigena taeniaeformis TaxID=6205 RepID=A0A0R3XAI1_HYDTA|nr:unnamed protein product [Hydatigera taeniaeformis]